MADDSSRPSPTEREKNMNEQRLLKAAGYGDILTRHGERNGGIDGLRGSDTIAAENELRKDARQKFSSLASADLREQASTAAVKLEVERLLKAYPNGKPRPSAEAVHGDPKPLATPSVAKPVKAKFMDI